ncbi:MAG TPA: ATP-dependent DNA ligase [Terriglobales bacterium]|nr:ATP-dependent DNA ligase [Terriglobales bacterium]
MKRLAEISEFIAGTTKKLEKTRIVSEYLKGRSADEAAVAAIFLSGRPFPVWEETTLQVGGSLLWRIVEELSGKTGDELTSAYRKLGDLGAVAGAVLPAREVRDLGVLDVARSFRAIAAARGPAAKGQLVRELLSQVQPLEAKYIVKIMTGDLRIGLKESLVEEAVAKAYGATIAQVQRANMLLGDIGGTLKLAFAGKLEDARMRLFHPLGFMLASPAENSTDALSYFHDAYVENKFDGIRAQVHISEDEVRIFSRTRDDITESFPELPEVLAAIPGEVILDGEIVAWSYLAEEGRALPFSALQQRLGRKKVSAEMMRRVPVAYLAFDVLYADGSLVIDRPLRERGQILDLLLAKTANHKGHQVTRRKTGMQQSLVFGEMVEHKNTQIIRSPLYRASSPEELDRLFDEAQARGNEGLMIKDPESAYAPGRRGKWWLKLKRELATLDVVVTAAEYGHGKRIGVLSDYTFAVRDGERLVNIGKAYSGLTDVEIAEMSKWFLEHTLEDQGFRRLVEPKVVLEVAFNNMMKSDRHESGYALRFPRIVRLRPDKLPEDADTLERAREIYERQAK